MISIICTNCRATLEIDDAFVGGVCRCQHCGTIQTVPHKTKARARAASPGAVAPAPAAPDGPSTGKSLYTAGSAAPSSGLDELAGVVASSGLSSGQLRSKPAGKTASPANRTLPLIIGGSAIALLLAGLLLWALLGGGEDKPSGASISPQGSSGQASGIVDIPPAVDFSGKSPSFVGLDLKFPSVIYVLDRGDATRESFDVLKLATLRSIRTLGPDRKFQIIFWHNADKLVAVPASPANATPDQIDRASRALEEVYASGQTDAKPALQKAFSSSPQAIVLVTGKGWQLDDGFVSMATGERKNQKTRIHAFSINGDSEALKTLAQKTNGQYREISAAALRRFAD